MCVVSLLSSALGPAAATVNAAIVGAVDRKLDVVRRCCIPVPYTAPGSQRRSGVVLVLACQIIEGLVLVGDGAGVGGGQMRLDDILHGGGAVPVIGGDFEGDGA